jgi:two-component system, chemotaxis family, protein-glutamate methylesterase/glutaminase
MLGKIIVIGASAGGLEPLIQLVAALPKDLPAAVFIVVHISSHSKSLLPSILSRAGVMKAFHPQPNEIFQPGRIYVAPPDFHLIVKHGHIHLARGPKENNHRPSIDVLFRTAARAYDTQVIGVVLSGVLDDGTAGLLAIKQQNGVTVVQDPNDALYSGMPLSAVENVEVDYILPASEIAATLVRLAYEPVDKNKILSLSDNLEIETDMAELEPNAMSQETRPGTPSAFACPDCGGVLWELNENNLVRFRCRVGHAFSVESLLAQQSDALEEALWTALRALEETAALRGRMAKRAEELGHPKRAQQYQEEAEKVRQRAFLIREALLNGNNKRDKNESDGFSVSS